MQWLQKVFLANQLQIGASWIGPSLLEGARQPVHLGSHSSLHGKSGLSLIQEWQPRVNYTFICQFFHPRKGILKKPAMNTNAQFGLATLWRRPKHKFAPQVVKDILASERFQHRLELWTIIHSLGTNTKAKFEQTKMLRSNDGGLTVCYAFRRLANNIQEPYRTLALQAIDASIKWWHRKPAPGASALRAPWSLSPNLQRTLKQLRHFAWQVLHFRRAACFLRIALSGLRQVVTQCKFRGRRGALWHVLKTEGSLARNIDFEVANFEVHEKTRRKTSILWLHSVKIWGGLARNARFDAPTCLVSSLWFSCGFAVSMGEAAKPLLFEGVQEG